MDLSQLQSMQNWALPVQFNPYDISANQFIPATAAENMVWSAPALSPQNVVMTPIVTPCPGPAIAQSQPRLVHPATVKQGSTQSTQRDGLFSSALLAHQQRVDKRGRYAGHEKARQSASQNSGLLRAWSEQQFKLQNMQVVSPTLSDHPESTPMPPTPVQLQQKTLAGNEASRQANRSTTNTSRKARQAAANRPQKAQKTQSGSQKSKTSSRPRKTLPEPKPEEVSRSQPASHSKVAAPSPGFMPNETLDESPFNEGDWDWLDALRVEAEPKHHPALRTGNDPMWYSGPTSMDI